MLASASPFSAASVLRKVEGPVSRSLELTHSFLHAQTELVGKSSNERVRLAVRLDVVFLLEEERPGQLCLGKERVRL